MAAPNTKLTLAHRSHTVWEVFVPLCLFYSLYFFFSIYLLLLLRMQKRGTTSHQLTFALIWSEYDSGVCWKHMKHLSTWLHLTLQKNVTVCQHGLHHLGKVCLKTCWQLNDTAHKITRRKGDSQNSCVTEDMHSHLFHNEWQNEHGCLQQGKLWKQMIICFN